MKRHVVYRFEWEPRKARLNLKAHGVPFERGATIFRDPDALTIFDQDHSTDEDRWITVGHDRSGALLVVSHTFREETEWAATIRLISARRATRAEAQDYERN